VLFQPSLARMPRIGLSKNIRPGQHHQPLNHSWAQPRPRLLHAKNINYVINNTTEASVTPIGPDDLCEERGMLTRRAVEAEALLDERRCAPRSASSHPVTPYAISLCHVLILLSLLSYLYDRTALPQSTRLTLAVAAISILSSLLL
jgi:hypothetical protein